MNFDLTHDLDLGFRRSVFEIALSQERGGPINMEQKGCESIGCYTYSVTLNYDFDLDFWRSNFKKLYHRNKRVDLNGTKRMSVDSMLDPSYDFKVWPHPWPWPRIFKV